VNAILISWPQITNVSEMDQLLGNSQDLERSINNCEHIFHITATITNVLEKEDWDQLSTLLQDGTKMSSQGCKCFINLEWTEDGTF
jgi:hypothetical protein